MTSKVFSDILKSRVESMVATLDSKGKEYSSDSDRLHNFKRAGRRLDCSPERALIGMAEKHFVSVMDLIDKVDGGGDLSFLTPEYINEKVGDSINYYVLLEALLKERIYSQSN